MTDAPADLVQSLARGLAIIRAFDGEHASLTLSEAARRADLSRAAAGRFLRTLEHLGYVRSDGRTFALTPRVLELGFGYLSALTLPEVAQPHLESLSRRIDESVSAAVLDGTDVVYVARVPTRRIMSVRITIGTRFPAWATSMGRVLLASLPADERAAAIAASDVRALTPATLADRDALAAELDRVAAEGWALADGQLEVGLRSLAVPLRDRTGAVVAAVNASTGAGAEPVEATRDRLLPALMETAKAIERELRLL